MLNQPLRRLSKRHAYQVANPDIFRQVDEPPVYVKLSGRIIVTRNEHGLPVGEGHSLLKALIDETQAAAATSASISGWINGLGKGVTVAKLHEQAQALPAAPALYLPMSRWRENTGLAQDEMETVDALFRRRSCLRRRIGQAAADAERIGDLRAQAMWTADLQKSGRTLARHALEAIKTLRPYLHWLQDDAGSRSSDILSALLVQCISGKGPRKATLKSVTPPELARTRTAHRAAFCEPVELLVRDGSKKVQVYKVHGRNISSGGIGLSDVPPLMSGVPVRVRLLNRGLLAGSVAWYRNGEAGIRFTQGGQSPDPEQAPSPRPQLAAE